MKNRPIFLVKISVDIHTKRFFSPPFKSGAVGGRRGPSGAVGGRRGPSVSFIVLCELGLNVIHREKFQNNKLYQYSLLSLCECVNI